MFIKGVNVCVCVVGVFISVEGSVGVNDLTYRNPCPFVLAFTPGVCPLEPAF